MPYKAVLIVEDREDDVMLLTQMLQRSSILNPIHAVSTIEDAQCYLKRDGPYANREKYPEPILLFVDLHLGPQSGFDLLDWLRRNRTPLSYGVVVLSGSDIQAINNTYRHGADSFLVKPLSFEDFRHLIMRLRDIVLKAMPKGLVVQYGDV